MIKKNMKHIIVGLIMIIVVLIIFPVNSLAAKDKDKEKAQKGLGFEYELVYPENQIKDEEITYFNLTMKPGQKQTVTIKLKNTGKEKCKVKVTALPAQTNTDGAIQYSMSKDFLFDKTLKYHFEKIVTTEKLVVLPVGKKEVETKIQIEMPKNEFDGSLHGAIELEKIEAKNNEKGNDFSVQNIYSYLIGMVLTENDKKVGSELMLRGVKAEQKQKRNLIELNIANTRPKIQEDLVVQAEVTRDDTDEVLVELNKAELRIAPHTIMSLPMVLEEGKKLEAGKYIAKIEAKSGKAEWKWNEKFTITREEAENFNDLDATVGRKKKNNVITYIAISVFIVVVMGIVFWVIRSFSNRKLAKKKLTTKKTTSKKKRKNSRID